MIDFVLLINRQGKVRLTKWYAPYSEKERTKAIHEVTNKVVGRSSRLCNVVEWRDKRLIYRRYASLYFLFCVDKTANDLLVFEGIHFMVELLDRYFNNVCELDLIFNFRKAHHIIDEFLIAGEFSESSKRNILRACSAHDQLEISYDVHS
ncbi:adaptor protein complex, sigma subunit [Kipferlia bialata]|uniref:AP complex subunit sigma n=1 Tax=Kipferlia bialata TaxID=797122 RepID=A0A391NLT6_9EUKA|nr:adaptor protein complex, sigma subunit [Kipferlia bialata]GCA62874.1 adaptor protein complex, sigma subunit [Kipferlia bialata]|eukprot:g3918.t1